MNTNKNRAELIASRGPDLILKVEVPTGAGRDRIVADLISGLPKTTGSICFCTIAKEIFQQLADLYISRGYTSVRTTPWCRLVAKGQPGIQIHTYQHMLFEGGKFGPTPPPEIGVMVLYDQHTVAEWCIEEIIATYRPRHLIQVSNLGSKT